MASSTSAEFSTTTPFVRQRVLQALREAAALTRDNFSENAPEIRRLTTDIRDRIDGWRLVTERDLLADPPGSTGAFCAFSSRRAEPVREFLLIPFGEIEVERPVSGTNFVFTRKHAESAVRWFRRMNRRLAVDYEHQTFDRLNTRPDGLRPAAGWIGGLEIREDGLWATNVAWTERAESLLRSGEYRYFSPVIYWTDDDYNDVAALGPVGLTNDPAMRGVTPLAASRDGTSREKDDANRMSAQRGADEAEAEPEIERREIALLRRQLLARDADAFIEAGIREGKILDANSLDWRDDYLRDPENAVNRLRRAPVLLPPERITSASSICGPSARRGSAPKNTARTLTFGIHPLGEFEDEDLAAYEIALAAGRVKHGA